MLHGVYAEMWNLQMKTASGAEIENFGEVTEPEVNLPISNG